jgi:hypothetical protein
MFRRGAGALPLRALARSERQLGDALARAPAAARAAVLSSVTRAQSTEASKTHFGFQTVDESKKAEMVGDVFKRVADK